MERPKTRKRPIQENSESIDGFKIPKRTSRPRAYTRTMTTAEQSNQFTALSSENTDDDNNGKEENVIPGDSSKKATPITLTKKEKWFQLNKQIILNKINCNSATTTQQEVKIRPATKKLSFTHQLKQDRTLKIVVRGVIVEIDKKDIGADLEEQGSPQD